MKFDRSMSFDIDDVAVCGEDAHNSLDANSLEKIEMVPFCEGSTFLLIQ